MSCKFVPSFVDNPVLAFSSPIINDYINQLEILKRNGKENTKECDDLINKINWLFDESIKLNRNNNIDFSNSHLLNYIGVYYEQSDEQNKEQKAIEFFTKSSDLNNSDAMNNLGYHYLEKENYPKAIEWYTKSANLNNNSSMYSLGWYYSEIKKDYSKAIEWYTKSANLGNCEGLHNLRLLNVGNDLKVLDYIFDLIRNGEQSEMEQDDIKKILLNKLSQEYLFNKMFEEINILKSVKKQGIDKVLINQILKHF